MSRSSNAGPRPRTGKRQLEHLRAELSDRDLEIFRAVRDLHLVSGRQLQRLHFPPNEHTALGAARSCNRVLTRLVECRGLVRLERRIGGVRAGSASFVYALGPVGRRVLGGDGGRRKAQEPSLTFLRHRLAVSELVVQLVEAGRTGQLTLLDYETEPTCWRDYVGPHGGREVLKPDLRVTIGTEALEHHWFVEVDLGSEHLPAVVRKCRQYAAYYHFGLEQERFGIFPKVAWLTATAERANGLAAALAAVRDLPHELFAVQPMAASLVVLTGREASA